jgi:hypothetical protein
MADGLDDEDADADATAAPSTIAGRLRSGIGRGIAAARHLIGGTDETNEITGTDETGTHGADERDGLTWEQRIREMYDLADGSDERKELVMDAIKQNELKLATSAIEDMYF